MLDDTNHRPDESNDAILSDHSLLRRYRGGSDDAATELYLRYAHRLRDLARSKLTGPITSRVDWEDIVQSVFGSVFRRVREGLYDVPPGEELWKLFLVVALNKIRDQGRYHNAAKRDVRQTTQASFMAEAFASQAATNTAACDFLELVVTETLDGMSPEHKQVVDLRMQGHEVQEIADETRRSKRTVERLLQQARAYLAANLDEE